MEAGRSHLGRSADVKPFLRSADMVVAPLTIARGIQNKVLEAMAMGRPVILSPEAATGIDAADGTHFVIARGNADFARAVDRLHGDADLASRIARSARDFVVREQGWEAMLAPLHDIMTGELRNAA